MINLCLVVIATQFSETKRRETERMLIERARRKHRSQSSSTLASSGGMGVGGCYVECVHYLEHLTNRARRRLARFLRRVRHRHAAAQPSDVGADRSRAVVAADSTHRRRRRRRRHRDLDPRSSDASATADNSPRFRAEPPDSAPPPHGVVACRGSPHTLPEVFEVDSPTSPVSVMPRRVRLLTVANNECPQISNTGLSRSITYVQLTVSPLLYSQFIHNFKSLVSVLYSTVALVLPISIIASRVV